ncbi:MAG TPA: sugar phosphate isomerase/epimerase [bacterium]|nr:sugar phosphate isomerase/epimerase [bacterium]
MKIGRNFTNLLELDYVSEEDGERFKRGEIDVPDLDALAQIKSKRDIVHQIKVAKEIGLDHIELDGGVPNPFLEMSGEEIERARQVAKESGITISLHLPYTYVGASTCAFQEVDRELAVTLQKRYLKFAKGVGAINAIMHPGTVPFYQAGPQYQEDLKKSLIKSLVELAKASKELGISFHIENNTTFDIVFVEPEEIYPVIEEVKREGLEIHYCFDIGHWFTRADGTPPKEIPDPPESIMEKIPAELLKEIHLNDYIPKIKKFHPPLHYQKGPLKRKNLEGFAQIVKEKGVELIVVETAVRDPEELLNAHKLLRDETDYLNEIFK